MTEQIGAPLRFNNTGNNKIPTLIPGLSYFTVEVSWGGGWVDLNDGFNYKVGAETLGSTTVNWRKISASSPVAEGSYLVHAVKDLTEEVLQVWVHGQNQHELAENVARIEELFSQLDYRVRVTMDNFREYWRAQPADWTLSRSHTLTHNVMASYNITVPRFPTVVREVVV